MSQFLAKSHLNHIHTQPPINSGDLQQVLSSCDDWKGGMQRNIPNWSKHQPNVKWRESTVKPSWNAACCTKSNTAALEERRTEPRTGAGEHKELNLLARSELQGADLDEGAGLLDGEHGGLELLRIRVATGKALHGGGGGSRSLLARGWVSAIT
jgi:hypothetical protein